MNREILTIEHLAPYLPYGLKWSSKWMIFNTAWLSRKNIAIINDGEVVKYSYSNIPENLKPLLHPLSRLTEEIHHNGERFVPIKKIYFMKVDSEFDPAVYSKNDSAFCDGVAILQIPIKEILTNEYWIIQKLFEWKFDVFGLIDKGLAKPIEQ